MQGMRMACCCVSAVRDLYYCDWLGRVSSSGAWGGIGYGDIAFTATDLTEIERAAYFNGLDRTSWITIPNFIGQSSTPIEDVLDHFRAKTSIGLDPPWYAAIEEVPAAWWGSFATYKRPAVSATDSVFIFFKSGGYHATPSYNSGAPYFWMQGAWLCCINDSKVLADLPSAHVLVDMTVDEDSFYPITYDPPSTPPYTLIHFWGRPAIEATAGGGSIGAPKDAAFGNAGGIGGDLQMPPMVGSVLLHAGGNGYAQKVLRSDSYTLPYWWTGLPNQASFGSGAGSQTAVTNRHIKPLASGRADEVATLFGLSLEAKEVRAFGTPYSTYTVDHAMRRYSIAADGTKDSEEIATMSGGTARWYGSGFWPHWSQDFYDDDLAVPVRASLRDYPRCVGLKRVIDVLDEYDNGSDFTVTVQRTYSAVIGDHFGDGYSMSTVRELPLGQGTGEVYDVPYNDPSTDPHFYAHVKERAIHVGDNLAEDAGAQSWDVSNFETVNIGGSWRDAVAVRRYRPKRTGTVYANYTMEDLQTNDPGTLDGLSEDLHQWYLDNILDPPDPLPFFGGLAGGGFGGTINIGGVLYSTLPISIDVVTDSPDPLTGFSGVDTFVEFWMTTHDGQWFQPYLQIGEYPISAIRKIVPIELDPVFSDAEQHWESGERPLFLVELQTAFTPSDKLYSVACLGDQGNVLWRLGQLVPTEPGFSGLSVGEIRRISDRFVDIQSNSAGGDLFRLDGFRVNFGGLAGLSRGDMLKRHDQRYGRPIDGGVGLG